MALHTAYLAALVVGIMEARHLMLLALAAYAAYVINAMQFLLKLRSARLEQPERRAGPASATAAGYAAE
jgi:3-vinyl bacteriochlorophyllide hydratase